MSILPNQMMKRPAELVFIPAPGIGHIVATIEMAKLLVARDDQLFITVLLMKLPVDQLFTTSDSSISPRITFINLPETHTDTQSTIQATASFFIRIFVENHKTHVRDAVAKLVESNQSGSNPRLAGFVVDMFCTTMIDVADEFGVPSYLFFTNNASCLAFMFHLQALRDERGEDVAELTDSEVELILPGFVNPLPAKVFPGFLHNKEGAAAFLKIARSFRHTKGILVNTILELESRALQSLCDGKTPPVYPVGPLLNLKSNDTHVGPDQTRQTADLLKWLDDQPASSVVFLCFGSRGSFGEAQVKGIACALEHSEHRFLWSLRQPPPKGTMDMPSNYADPREVLPEGFLERTADIGKVIGWAPQVTVLAHPAIGGFVSHCGWNSTLESLWYGVPIATWPMYAEQQLNAFEMVKEWGLAAEVRMDYRKDYEVVASAEDIETGIRQVMKLDSDMRERVKVMSEKSKKALMDGGSSYSSLGCFIDQI